MQHTNGKPIETDTKVAATAPDPELLSTGVPNLDVILGGGLRRGTIAIVVGAPGTGKTTLALQIAFHHARREASVLYFTGLAETLEKLINHNRNLGFFEASLIGDRLQFANLTDLLESGSEETEQAILATVRERQAGLVILDGFGGMRRLLPDAGAAAHFVYSLGRKLGLVGVTLLIALEGDPDAETRYAELNVCDLLISLRRERRGASQRRLLEVLKVRGARELQGVHAFQVDAAGVSVWPRFESLAWEALPWGAGRASFGIADIDSRLGGGLTVGTATLAAGSPGTGKTLLGLHYVAEGARANEPGLFLSLLESIEQLQEKARVFGIDLGGPASDLARLVEVPSWDLEPDRLMERVRADVERRGVRRLVIDSLNVLERAVEPEARRREFIPALVAYLRARNVTTYLPLDIPKIVGPELELGESATSILGENIILLRHLEYQGALRRFFSVLKMRFSEFDPSIDEFTITRDQGFRMSGKPPVAEDLLTGAARPAPWASGQSRARAARKDTT